MKSYVQVRKSAEEMQDENVWCSEVQEDRGQSMAQSRPGRLWRVVNLKSQKALPAGPNGGRLAPLKEN